MGSSSQTSGRLHGNTVGASGAFLRGEDRNWCGEGNVLCGEEEGEKDGSSSIHGEGGGVTERRLVRSR